MKIYSRITVSRSFRNEVSTALPLLKNNSKAWNFIQYLLFPTFTEDDGTIVIPYDVLREIADYSNKSNHFNACRFLRTMQKIIPNLTYSDYDRNEQRARVIYTTGLPDHIVALAQKERLELRNSPGDVYFVTGLAFTAQRKAEHRMYDKTQALEAMSVSGCEDAVMLLDYMNNLPPNRFSTFTKHLSEAFDAAKQIEHEPTRNRQLHILKSIAIQHMPFYKPTAKTVRISSSNESVLRLRRDIRSILVKDLISIDLAHAQLAISAKLWNISSIQSLLEKDVNLWKYISSALGYDNEIDFIVLKPIIKQVLYATMFGMSRDNLITGTRKFDGLTRLLEPFRVEPHTFLDIDIMKDVFDARHEAYSRIYRDKGTTDIYGRWISTEQFDPNSVAAQEVQSMELFLMMPVVRAAKSTQDFTLNLWLHDGCWISVAGEKRFERWTHMLYHAIIENSKKVGIITKPEFTYPDRVEAFVKKRMEKLTP
jgi:hypothetical protein